MAQRKRSVVLTQTKARPDELIWKNSHPNIIEYIGSRVEASLHALLRSAVYAEPRTHRYLCKSYCLFRNDIRSSSLSQHVKNEAEYLNQWPVCNFCCDDWHMRLHAPTENRRTEDPAEPVLAFGAENPRAAPFLKRTRKNFFSQASQLHLRFPVSSVHDGGFF
ncbi:hypothetical protein TGPRC2_318632 [Toxoplasma gondii TgCatPRC2]|uniref:Uncharacterized protein n=5 Tax=Toxoplasma gondii TaxID=5811 RepID=S7UKC1_TOXGG|nr:hypothetical protein TGME49_318632 [Toxoplasma gondii ME49]EPR58195.1 hypothetical protein TGGT1_318632 [Toxoplasma gondii GT1]KAF4644975.1 hypothetical protein TGRH88_007910 [Toxoplasma gondii]KYF39156.1 hypothetical protein TGARI_318632 [Toxoplasma gondii ARI]KYK66912.1 hypothetical protein TGPRC2_318632 [Toxoplasma gondii TgCatPRC2]EPT31473.1 hypothetical protein TGME49_318632 [Toxoplasma gondii ME49]|eukprot:XP_018638007.1 hypothetical protein TGME49_318632 [Toxoplasma gondii ME49]